MIQDDHYISNFINSCGVKLSTGFIGVFVPGEFSANRSQLAQLLIRDQDLGGVAISLAQIRQNLLIPKIDVIIIAFIIYTLWTFVHRSRAGQLAKGFFFIFHDILATTHYHRAKFSVKTIKILQSNLIFIFFHLEIFPCHLF